MSSFDGFKGILPYASEVFGIYQLFLGWKSRPTANRYERFRASLYNELAARALVNARAPIKVKLRETQTRSVVSRSGGASFTIVTLEPLDLDVGSAPHCPPTQAVFEHRFYLKDGVQFGGDSTAQPVFSQWMEILPTDQIAALAALAVEYCPKTLQAREPSE